jgi:predicted RNA-binding protein with PIN domain
MTYIIDGHNLIPHIPGLKLSDLDDEAVLLKILQEFSQKTRRPVEVYFDRAVPGHAGSRQINLVKSIFIPEHSTADQAIIRKLYTLGKGARNYIVVTSDVKIQTEAKARHAKVISAKEFAIKLSDLLQPRLRNDNKTENVVLEQNEIQEWLEIFKSRKFKD